MLILKELSSVYPVVERHLPDLPSLKRVAITIDRWRAGQPSLPPVEIYKRFPGLFIGRGGYRQAASRGVDGPVMGNALRTRAEVLVSPTATGREIRMSFTFDGHIQPEKQWATTMSAANRSAVTGIGAYRVRDSFTI